MESSPAIMSVIILLFSVPEARAVFPFSPEVKSIVMLPFSTINRLYKGASFMYR